MKTIFVTGAGGYIGIPLCGKLLERGHRVVAYDRFFFGKDKFGDLADTPGLEIRTGDIRTLSGEALRGVDTMIDLAGLSNDLSAEMDTDITRQINFDGCARIAGIARKAGVSRYIFASSASVYGHGTKLRLEEGDACHPQTLYAKSKLHVENRLRELSGPDFETVIFRNATVFGLAPRMRFDLAVNIMTLRAWKDRVIYVMGGGQQWRPFVHVNDVAGIMAMSVEADAATVAGEVFNVGDESMNFQISQIAQCVVDVIPNVRIHDIPDDPDKRTYNLSFAKIRGRLGFRPSVEVRDGVAEIKQALERGAVNGGDPACYTLQWYKSLQAWKRRIDELAEGGAIL